jgi:nitroreductase
MELYEVMRTARTARSFDPRPVPDEVLHRVLDNARFAPSGGNRQGWRVVVVQDQERRTALKDLYMGPWRAYSGKARALAGNPEADVIYDRADRFAERLDQAPVHVLVFVRLNALAIADADLDRPSIVGGGSVYPFVQNLLLACREEGLGASLTTIMCMVEPEVLAMLEAPEGLALAAFIAVGYPPPGFTGKPLARNPVEDFAFAETFAQPFAVPAS